MCASRHLLSRSIAPVLISLLTHAAPHSSRSRSNTRFAVCLCFRGMERSASSQLSMIGTKGSSFGRLTSAVRRQPGGTENVIIFATVSREMLKAFAA
jgi:hypothetical protein